MDDLILFEHKQQLHQKNRERFNQRRNGRKSMSVSSPASSHQNNSELAARSDSEDEGNDRANKRSKLNHGRDEDQLKCSPSIPKSKTTKSRHQKSPPQNAVDETKLAKLRACFSSDSDSDDDDDPFASINKRQIAARYRKKGWKLLEDSADASKAANSPEKVDSVTQPSPASFKQPSEDSVLPLKPTLETKTTSLNHIASERGYDDNGNNAKMDMEDTIPPPKTPSTASKKTTSIMKSTATIKAEVDNKYIHNVTMIDDSAAKTVSPLVKKASTMMNVDVDEDNEPMSLTIVSWNISSAESSRVAPDPDLRVREAPRLIREEILRSQPDVIALQETAYPSFGAEKFASFGYVSIGSQTALHTNEYVDLLVKRELAIGARRISLQPYLMKDLPAVAAILTLPNRTRITVASLHLPHTKEAAPLRTGLCGAIMEQLISQNSDGIILTGDFNMRDFEDKTTEKLCGGNWVDAWKMVTKSDKETKFTWNSRVNMYHGPENFSWTCRLDRCYVKSEKVTLKHFGLIGNEPVDGKQGDYLSDHYGIVVKCDVASSNSSKLDNDTKSSVGLLLPVGTTSKSGNSSLRDGTNAAALRTARLQRFEKATSSVTNQTTKKGNREIIDLLGDSDNEDNNAMSNSLKSDRALAERLQREEAMSAHLAFAEDSVSQVDSSDVRTGVFDTMRNKRAYLQDSDQSHPKWGILEQQLVAQGMVSGQVPSRFKDSHPQAWSSGGWVWVKNPQYAKNPKARVDTEDDVARMSTEWKSLVESNAIITHQQLIDLAQKHNVLHGKWLLYVKAEDVETEWPKIRNAIIEGKLGSTAKISDTPERGSHAVCIYCPNFLDKDDLLRVRRSISNDVGMYKTSVLRFKLDAVTYLGLYTGNKWKLRTTSYECGGKKDEECSTLISSWEKCTCAMSNSCKRCYKKPKKGNYKEDVCSITGLKRADASAV